MSVSKHQKFEMMEVSRKDIKGATYNPRMISPQARNRLKKGLEKNGLVQPLIWNKRTGNLVGGHQRLGIIDDLEGSDDYSLTVAVVDVNESQEKQINVLLNNDSAQGFWDEGKLLSLFEQEQEGVDYESFGFSRDQEDYFAKLMESNKSENDELMLAMNENIGFENDVEEYYSKRNLADLEKKREAKEKFESVVEGLLIDTSPEDWKAKSDEEKKSLDTARNNFKHEKFEYNYVKISFDSFENKKKWLERFRLPANKETLHESEINS